MSLVKWMRKNNRKIMTIVVILIMVSFVGGYGLQQYLRSLGRGGGNAAAFYLDGESITRMDIDDAGNELKVLRGLLAVDLLRFRQTAMGTPDIKSRLLSQLLYPDTQVGAMISMEMKQAMSRGQLNVTSDEIDAFFRQAQGRSEIFWILLNAEAKRAGCVVSVSRGRQALKQMIPQITQGRANAAQVVNSVMNNYGISEDGVISIFSDLLAVIAYGEMVTSNEDVTTNQLRAMVGRNRETLSTEFVKFTASDYLDDQADPAEDVLIAQFDKYKSFTAGDITDSNPYGFGYMLPDRVALEYIIVKMDDVADQIDELTPESMEKYYTANIQRFSENVKIDPNNPDSETISQPKEYAEVVNEIRRILTDEKTKNLANLIINDAVELADAGYQALNMEEAAVGELKDAAVSYGDVAATLTGRYKVKPYTGKTGMLSMGDLSGDRNLGMLALQGQSQVPVGLSKMVFAIEELGVTKLGRFETATPKMWENIGPLSSRVGSDVAIVRVVDAAKTEEPADLNVSYSIKPSFAGSVIDTDKQSYSVKEQVAADCKLLSAMKVAGQRADEFAKLLGDKEWTEAVDAYNEIHKATDDQGKELPGKKLKSEKLSNRRRSTDQDIDQARQLVADNPMAIGYIKNMIESKELSEKLFDCLGEEKTEVTDINKVMEFAPGSSYYVIKDISRTEVTKDDYTKTKAFAAFQVDMVASDSLALIHYSPDGIIERMGFKWSEQDKTEDAEKQETEEEASS